MKIKFRAWDKDKKWMIYDVQDAYDGMWSERNSDEVNDYYSYVSTFQSFTDEEEFNLMQYTGLKDKKDIEIYEGDICKVSAEEPYSNDYFITEYDWEMIMAADFSYGAFQFREINDKHMSIYYIETQDMDIEVIGNIYEDKSLLKGTKDE